MMTKQDMWERAFKFAHVLYASNISRHVLSDFFKYKKRSQFIEIATKLIDCNSGDDVFFVSETVKKVHEREIDDVQYFISLIRFNYATLK